MKRLALVILASFVFVRRPADGERQTGAVKYELTKGGLTAQLPLAAADMILIDK